MNGLLYPQPQGVLASDDPFMDPKTMAMLQGALGLLSASGPSRTPVSFGQVLGQGGRAALGGYQQAQMAQKQNMLTNLQMLQLKKEIEKQDALKNLFAPSASAGATVPLPQQALTQGAAEGYIGPTVTNNARLDAMQRNPVISSGYQPIPVDRLAGAAAQGVNIEPFLKLNAEARPDVMSVDMGDKIRLIDKKTMKVLEERPKGSAPGSTPFEAGGQTPEQYRDFLLTKGRAGAAQQITNVNSFMPASEEAQKRFMDRTATNYEALRNSAVTLKNIEEAKAAIPGARGFMGPLGEVKLEAAKFLKNRLGVNIDTAGINSAEELRSRVFMQIMDNLKKMDAQPSQMQQQIMMEALGKLGTDPDAMSRVLDVFAEVIRGKVDIHNQEVQSGISRGVKFPYDPIIKLPEVKRPEQTPRVRQYNPATGRIE